MTKTTDNTKQPKATKPVTKPKKLNQTAQEAIGEAKNFIVVTNDNNQPSGSPLNHARRVVIKLLEAMGE